MTAERRPGGWVDGIGWVARLCDVPLGSHVAMPNMVNSDGLEVIAHHRTELPVVLVLRWADGTTPTAPAPHVEDMPEWDALVEATTAPGSVTDQQWALHLIAAAVRLVEARRKATR